MVAIGDQISTPDAGWQRYDADIIPEHLGTDWKTVANTTGRVFEGGSVMYSNVIGNYIKFNFTGGKLRLIAEYGTAYDPNVEVSIDGVTEYINLSTTSSSYIPQRLVLEKTGLSDGSHEVIVKKVSGTGNFHIDAIDIDASGILVRQVGSQLKTPDTGWKRIETNDSKFSYSSGWLSLSGASYSGGSTLYTQSPEAYVEFKFYGKDLRIIESIAFNRPKKVDVYIDGAFVDSFSQYIAGQQDFTLVYEKTGLSQGVHTIKIVNKGVSGDYCTFDAIDVKSDSYLVAQIGQQLTTPESGWKRYDDIAPAIMYEGSGWIAATGDANTHAGTAHYFALSGATTNSINFKFYGTKMRIIDLYWNNRVDNVTVEVDGEISTYNPNNPANKYKVLVFEATDLALDFHEVKITTTSISGTFSLDAVDIDDTGRLYHQDEVTKITELTIGKRIRCNYVVATSGKSGTFGSLGKETSSMVSTTPSSVPSGDFYFIMVDEYNEKKVLIADRNIQTSMSWDALNSEGLIFGVQKNLNDNRFKFVLRIMSGGINASDKDNDWDKYIVSTTLDGKITAGDNSVWNWSGTASWTSTTNSASANRTGRGNTSAGASGFNATSSVTATATGFRPVLEIEILPMNRSFINYEGSYRKFDVSTETWKTISATLPSEDTFINDGMDDLSVLDRKNKGFVASMTANGSLGSGKIFKGNIDLKKYFEITSISVR